MSRLLIISAIVVSLVGLGVFFFIGDTQTEQNIEVFEQMEQDLKEDIEIIIVFETDLEKAKKTVLENYPDYEIIHFEKTETYVIIQIRRSES